MTKPTYEELVEEIKSLKSMMNTALDILNEEVTDMSDELESTLTWISANIGPGEE